MSPEMLTVKELKAKLSALGAPTDGLKSVLVARLTALVEPSMRSAEDAAADRARAGESRAVEHVADLHPTQAVRAARHATKAPHILQTLGAWSSMRRGEHRDSLTTD